MAQECGFADLVYWRAGYSVGGCFEDHLHLLLLYFLAYIDRTNFGIAKLQMSNRTRLQ